MLNISIANHAESNNRALQQATFAAGTQVKDILASAGINLSEGQSVAINGVDVTLSSHVNVGGGLMTITGEAKAA